VLRTGYLAPLGCWNCFSDCKCGGNVLDFVAKMENLDPYEAAVRLNEWFSLGLDKRPPPTRENRPADGSQPKTQTHLRQFENLNIVKSTSYEDAGALWHYISAPGSGNLVDGGRESGADGADGGHGVAAQLTA
jgi:hypothetical protein